MLLKHLSLKNFRQFKKADLDFDHDSEHNVTVIHGQNGSGKTTILNAFQWVLFESMGSVKHPNRVAYQGEMVGASPGDRVTVEVELTFDHDGVHHLARRKKVYRKSHEDDLEGQVIEEVFHVEYLLEDGNVNEPSNPESYVRQIIPEDLGDLFFFDGEYISDLSGVDNQDEIQQAIRQMMGLSILDRSIRHLDWVESEFRKELRTHGGDRVENLIDERDELENEREKLDRKRKDLVNSKAKFQDEIQDINNILEQLGETAKYQEKRKELETEISELEEDKENIDNAIEKLISKKAFLTYTIPAIANTAEDLDELRERGEIPSELDNRFVQSLLDEGSCICGRDITKGTPEFERVEGYKSTISADGLDQAAIQLIGHLDHVRSERRTFFDRLDELLSERKDIQDEIDDLHGRIDDISTKIDDLTDEIEDLDKIGESISNFEFENQPSPSDLEGARSKKKNEVKEIDKDIAILMSRIKDKDEEIEDLEEKIDEAEAEQLEAELAKKRMQAAKAVRNELNDYYQGFQQKVRQWADERVDETFDEVSSKNYKARVNDSFELIIEDRDHGTPIEVDKSRGERQIASLSFIGSLVRIAKERYEADTESEYFTGGIYPAVMDSPFGSLDKSHREEVCKIMPMLADQVIVMVTDGQWEGPVQQTLEPLAGKQYYLDFDQSGGDHGAPVTQVLNQPTAAATEV